MLFVLLLLGTALGGYRDAGFDQLKPSDLTSRGGLTVNVDGKDTTLYVVGGSDGTKVSGSTLTLAFNDRVYLATTDRDPKAWDPNEYYQFQLLGSELSYKADISQVECSCNAALYFVNMPGYGQDGQPYGGEDGSYYCDANFVNGNWCPEMDVLESNKYTFASTPHTCVGPFNNWYSSCDRGGCGSNISKMDGSQFGPGKVIDTNQEWTHKVTFATDGSGNTLTGIHNEMLQGSSYADFWACNDANYMSQFSEPLKQMVIAISFWGCDYNCLSWLDGGMCAGDCNNSGEVTFSDITLKTSGHRPSTSSTDPPSGKGCCSWGGGVCQVTGDYCEVKEHCETDCGGVWIPGGTPPSKGSKQRLFEHRTKQ